MLKNRKLHLGENLRFSLLKLMKTFVLFTAPKVANCYKKVKKRFPKRDFLWLLSFSDCSKNDGSFIRHMSTTGGKKPNLITVAESKRFMIDCFTASNTSRPHAEAMADLLVIADYRGHFSHGMNRLEMYINDLHAKTTDGMAVPKIIKETPATAWVDGKNALGAVVGNFSMDLAIAKAKTIGVGWVAANQSNHYGIAGYYTMKAAEHGLIGMSMTNTSPLMSPTRSTDSALGTNPLSLAAPAHNGDSFVLDMATTAVAVGKIEMQRRKNEPIPLGWAQDPHGKPTTDAELAFKTGCLMPLGGAEITSGYKGYGLAALVEILCGVLGGGRFATQVRKWSHSGGTDPANLGQCFVAVNPDCFAPGFKDRVTELNSILRGMPKVSEMESTKEVAGNN